jgi:transcriptional regulator with XRE-family HTH domain
MYNKTSITQAMNYVKTKHNLTTVDLAKMLDTSRVNLTSLLNGHSYPNADLIIKFFNEFIWINKEWFFSGKESPEKTVDATKEMVHELTQKVEKQMDLIMILQDTIAAYKLRESINSDKVTK